VLWKHTTHFEQTELLLTHAAAQSVAVEQPWLAAGTQFALNSLWEQG
jgi:hypothetical protein